MVLAAGFTSRREPASFSRRLVELAFEGTVELVVTEVLLGAVHAVLGDPKFMGRVPESEAALFIEGLASVATVLIPDEGVKHERRSPTIQTTTTWRTPQCKPTSTSSLETMPRTSRRWRDCRAVGLAAHSGCSAPSTRTKSPEGWVTQVDGGV